MSADALQPPPGVPLLVGVGASAGGVEALTGLVRELPPALEAAVLVVLHVSPAGTSALARILDRAGPLSAVPAQDGVVPEPGHVYVAPPDRHLLLDDGAIRLSAGPRENGHRPAVDPLLRSLADYGRHAAGVILSGTRDDGTLGLARLVAAGGTALLQDPAESAYDGMIRSARAHTTVDAVLPVAGLAARIAHLATHAPMSDASTDRREEERSSTRYTCPDCGGHLTREATAGTLRYACEVGHVYAPESLDVEQGLAVERVLWEATRMLGDRAVLLAEMATRSGDAGRERSAAGFRTKAQEAQRASDAVRTLLEEGRIPLAGADAAAE